MQRVGLARGESAVRRAITGAVESALKGLNAVVEPEVKFFHEGTLAKVKEALATKHSEGREAFQSAFDEGSKWSLEETVRKVLDE